MSTEKSSKQGGMKKLGSNIVIFTVGSFASKLMGYFLLPFYTSILNEAEYGTYDIIITTVSLLFPLMTLMITESTMRYALEEHIDKRKVFSLSIVIIGLSMLLFTALSPLFLLSDIYRDYFVFFGLYYFAYTAYTLVTQFAKGLEETKVIAIGGLIGTAVTLMLNILLMAVIPLGLVGYFIATIIGSTSASVYLIIRCNMHRYVCIPKAKDWQLLKEMLKYSIPIMPNALSWWISTSSDKYLISYFHGATATGLYSVAYKIPSLMTVFTGIFFNAWQISSVEDYGSEKSVQMYSTVYRYLFSLLFAVAAIVIVGVRIIAKVLFAGNFFEAWKFVPVLIIAYLFHDLAAYIGSVYTATKKTNMLFRSTLVGSIVNIVLNVILIPKYGAMAGAITTMISYFIVWVMRFIDTRKYIPIRYNYLLEGATMLLIVTDCLIVTFNVSGSFVISIAICAAVLIMHRRTYLEVIKSLKPFARGILRKEF